MNPVLASTVALALGIEFPWKSLLKARSCGIASADREENQEPLLFSQPHSEITDSLR